MFLWGDINISSHKKPCFLPNLQNMTPLPTNFQGLGVQNEPKLSFLTPNDQWKAGLRTFKNFSCCIKPTLSEMKLKMPRCVCFGCSPPWFIGHALVLYVSSFQRTEKGFTFCVNDSCGFFCYFTVYTWCSFMTTTGLNYTIVVVFSIVYDMSTFELSPF